MSPLVYLLAKRLGLTPRHGVSVRRDVRVPAEDVAVMLTDVYMPKGLARAPTVLIRSPYGRRPFGFSMGWPFASQGYVTVIQSCRGTAGSEGEFDPHHHEKSDGLAAVEWVKAQPFFDGTIVTYGPSYLGYNQWAIAAAAGPEVKAMSMQLTLSDFSQMNYAGGSLQLHGVLSWTFIVHSLESTLGRLRLGAYMGLRLATISQRSIRKLPIAALDEEVTGRRKKFWRDWMEHCSAYDPWWQSMSFEGTIPEIRRPCSFVSGWHDVFTPWSLRDFEALQKAGAPVRIQIGPWRHQDAGAEHAGIHDALDLLAEHVRGQPSARSAPVELYVMQADQWRRFDSWPPRETERRVLHLQPDGGLAPQAPVESGPVTYRYDPADPTPSVGGPALPKVPHTVDNRALEARSDVLCFTTGVLEQDLDVIGGPAAELHVQSSAPSADFFVRLCDVDEGGVSRNVCDFLQRVALPPGGGPQRVRVELWPTAYRFARGHRVRVQVSSGAFPRWARNLGTGESLPAGTTMRAAQQSVHFGSTHPSVLSLPVCPDTAGA